MMAFQTKDKVPLKTVPTQEALAVACAAYRIRKGYKKETQRFSEDKPTHLILKVGFKYLLVDTSGSSYVRYATKILHIPTPSKGFSDLYSK